MTKSAPLLPVVAVALGDGAGRVLVQQRPAGKQHAGLWEFPGGKIEEGETPEGALVRELAEELGVVVAVDALRPAGFASRAHGDRHLLLLLYRCERWLGEPRALDAAAIAWRDLDALAALPMPPADRALVAQLRSRDGA
jgi:8-oxo-dGTP diphosphatase